MKPLEIYIADDHKIFTDGLESILEKEEDIAILGTARNGRQLLGMMQNRTPDIVLLDISMPEMSGDVAAGHILAEFPTVKIMMLTMHNTVEHIAPLVKKGVHGYMLKNTGKSELLHAIRTLHQEGKYYSGEIAAKLAKMIYDYEEQEFKLTRRELEVLGLVFEGLSTTAIGERLFLSPRTVENHRSNMLSKTGTKNTAHLIRLCLEKGLIQPKENTN